MNKQFHEIYNELYAEYIYEFGFPRRKRFWEIEYESEMYLLRKVRNSIEHAEMTFDKEPQFDSIEMRPDAKYFLLTNFHLMVLQPLIDSQNRFWDQTRVEKRISGDIEADIREIVKEAYNQTKERNKKYISGHTIMRVIDSKWKQLMSTRFEIWGDDE
jgi:hypothetical protein